MPSLACAACRHQIDSAARICPYCGSDPKSGQKIVDANALLQEMFEPRRLTATESVLEYARHRQGIVIAISAAVLFLILAALHAFVTRRNESMASSAPAVPLSEITDISNLPEENKAQAMPDLTFTYSGNPQALRTFIVEQGAVTPPEVLQQQAHQPQPATAPAAAPGVNARPAPVPPAVASGTPPR